MNDREARARIRPVRSPLQLWLLRPFRGWDRPSDGFLRATDDGRERGEGDRGGPAMRVEKLTVSRTKKVNLGNYESAEILVSATADVDTNENPLEVGAKLASMTAQLLEQHGPK